MEVFEHMVPSLLRLHRCRDPKVSFESLRWMCILKIYFKKKDTLIVSWNLVWYYKRWRVVVSAEDLSSLATTVNSVKLDFAETVSTLKRSFWQKQFLVICGCTSSWSRRTRFIIVDFIKSVLPTCKLFPQVGNRHKVVCKPCDDGWILALAWHLNLQHDVFVTTSSRWWSIDGFFNFCNWLSRLLPCTC